MRVINPKKLEFFFKNLFGLSDTYLLKKRANRYLRKNTEKEIRILNKIVDPNKASLDIGVYRGIYSFFLTDLSTHVYAFEANPLIFDKIKKSFKNKTNITIENIALSSSSGFTDLRIPIRDNSADYDNEQKYRLGTATIHEVNNLENKEFKTIKNIKKSSLDDYIFHHQIGFIKIDVEGHELDVIKGGKKLISKNKPVLLIEIEERHSGINPNLTINEILKLGYECFFVNEYFSLQSVENHGEIKNNNFIFLPKYNF